MAVQQQQQSGASLKPSAFVHGGGLLDDVDVTIKECRFVRWNYQGKIDNDVLALGVELQPDDGEAETQYFSAGDLKFFVPSKDGKKAIPVGSRTGLSDSTNAAQFVASIFSAGFPEDKMEDDVSVLEGLYCHVNRVTQPSRSGIAKPAGEREKTVMTVTKIHRMPWESAGKKGTSKGSAKANGAAVEDEVESKAVEIVSKVLAQKDGSIDKKDLSKAIFSAMGKENPTLRNKVVGLAFKDEFLNADGRPWAFDGTTLVATE